MKNKKIVSYTLAATLATSIVPNADSEVVSATENNSVENNADENLKENGKIVNEEIQLKRYEKGVKANWLNPNSTDVEIINNEDESSNHR